MLARPQHVVLNMFVVVVVVVLACFVCGVLQCVCGCDDCVVVRVVVCVDCVWQVVVVFGLLCVSLIPLLVRLLIL